MVAVVGNNVAPPDTRGFEAGNNLPDDRRIRFHQRLADRVELDAHHVSRLKELPPSAGPIIGAGQFHHPAAHHLADRLGLILPRDEYRRIFNSHDTASVKAGHLKLARFGLGLGSRSVSERLRARERRPRGKPAAYCFQTFSPAVFHTRLLVDSAILLPVDYATLHDKADALDHRDVAERIAWDRDDVGPKAGL